MDEQIKQGVERRSFLKGAAVVAGTTVWATPTIQSMVAPAVAQSVPCTDYVRFKVDIDNGVLVLDSGDASGTDCLVAGYAGAVAIESFPMSGTNPWTFTINGREVTLQVVYVSAYEVTVIITGDGVTDIDVSLKAGATNKNQVAECSYSYDGVASPTYTRTINLVDKTISHVSGTMCIEE